MLSEAKAVLLQAVQAVGIERVALNAADTVDYKRDNAYPYAAIISAPGRADEPQQLEILLDDGKVLNVRMRRVLPLVCHLFAVNESEISDYCSQFLAHLPRQWSYKGVNGSVDLMQEEYSDYNARMNARYEAALLIEMAVDVGVAQDAKPTFARLEIGGIE